MKIKLPLIFLFSIFCFTILTAQRNMVAAAGEMMSSTSSVSYSIGQIFYEPLETSSGNLLQGLQQPYEWHLVNTVDEFENVEISLQFFPNPTTDFLFLEMENSQNTSFDLRLFDSSGKLLKKRKFKGGRDLMSLGHLPAGIYYLNLKANDLPDNLSTYKIIKN